MAWTTTPILEPDDVLDMVGTAELDERMVRSVLVRAGRQTRNGKVRWLPQGEHEHKAVRAVVLALRYHGWPVGEIKRAVLPCMTVRAIELTYQAGLREQATRSLTDDGAVSLGAWCVSKLMAYAEQAEEEGDFDQAAKHVTQVADIVKRRGAKAGSGPVFVIGAALEQQIERVLEGRSVKALQGGKVEVVDTRPAMEVEVAADSGDEDGSEAAG